MLLFIMLFSGLTLFAAPSVTLSWTSSVTPGTSVNVYRGTATGGPYTLLTATPLAVGTVTYVDTTVTPGNTYFYVVTALLNGLESIKSNETKAVMLPQPPTSLGNSVVLSFLAPQVEHNATTGTQLGVWSLDNTGQQFFISAQNQCHHLTSFQAFLDHSAAPFYSLTPNPTDFTISYNVAYPPMPSGAHTITNTVVDDTGASVSIDTAIVAP